MRSDAPKPGNPEPGGLGCCWLAFRLRQTAPHCDSLCVSLRVVPTEAAGVAGVAAMAELAWGPVPT